MLVSPFYIEPRKGVSHLDLNGQWLFTWEDAETDCPDFQKNTYPAKLPDSTYFNIFEAGLLPHPYKNNNSAEYLWVREKVFYYKRTFEVEENHGGKDAVLCFDGVAYYSKILLNGKPVCEHEGMFGGPFVNVTDSLNFGGENELIVEIRAPSYKDPNFTARNTNHTNTQIVPWCAAGDEESGSQNFMVMGIWRGVRIELLNKKHISRPVLTTESISDGAAHLRFEAEILDGLINELKVDTGINSGCYSYTRAFDGGLTGVKSLDTAVISFSMTEKQSGVTAYSFDEEITFDDRGRSGINPEYSAAQFYEKEFTLSNPKFWYPHTLGEPFLYEIKITLSENGKILDEITFDSGVRTVRLLPAKGEKHRHRWGKFQFEVNGRRFFLKGMNHMPVDFLYRERREDIEWVIETAKHAGIELLRAWNGGGSPESDEFYRLCDSHGILVWQDWFLANMEAPAYPQDVLEEQMMLNVYRLRNHASLAVHCGGNEFNPYAKGNAAAMYVMERTAEDLDPQRPFIRTTADGGSAHIYRDIEPIWFSKRYKQLPFVGESGIHSFPKPSTLKRLIPAEEYERLENRLPDLFDRSEMEKFPSFLGHFVEYIPERIPRMIARASTITDVRDLPLSDFAGATQMASYEFYQMMLLSMRDNYPVTAGIMPWVYKRPWPTVGIQLVDGLGYPIAPYYSVKNAYSPLCVMLRLPELTYAPGEEISLTAVIFNDSNTDVDGTAKVTVYSPDLESKYKYESHFSAPDGTKTEIECGCFNIPEAYVESAFIISVKLTTLDEFTAQTVYWPKCLESLRDAAEREKRRSAPTQNPIYGDGPWLKETVMETKTSVCAELVSEIHENERIMKKICVKNTGSKPAFPVTVDSAELPPFYMNDNYFLLEPGEEREINVTIRDGGTVGKLNVSGWNFENITV